MSSKPVSLKTLAPLNKFAKASIELRELRKTVCRHLKFHKIAYGEFEILYLLKEEVINPTFLHCLRISTRSSYGISITQQAS